MIKSTFAALLLIIFLVQSPETSAQNQKQPSKTPSKTKKTEKATKPETSVPVPAVAQPTAKPSNENPSTTTPKPVAGETSIGATASKMVFSTIPTFQAATRLPENAAARPVGTMGFINVDVGLPTTTGTLVGTLTVPNNASSTATVPFVLILNTNTVFDRNGYSHNNRDSSMHGRYLAEALAKNGIASLRYDTRGVGKSMNALKSEASLSFERTVTDAADWITQMRKDKRFSTFTVIGFSLPNDFGREASLAAILMTQRMRMDGLVCVAGESRKYLSMIRAKAAMAFPKHTSGYIDSLAQVLETGRRFELKSSDGIAYNFFRPAILPYVMELNTYDPKSEMAKVEIPSVVVHGAMDYSIAPEVVESLATANPNSMFVKLQGTSFYMKNGREDMNTPALQKHKIPISADFVKLVTEYVFSVNKLN